MNVKTGDIYTPEQAAKLLRENAGIAPFLRPMELAPTVTQKLRRPANRAAIGRVGRNEPCPCGSGLKFKKCCLEND